MECVGQVGRAAHSHGLRGPSSSTQPFYGELSGTLCGDQAGLNPSTKGELDEPLPLSRDLLPRPHPMAWGGGGIQGQAARSVLNTSLRKQPSAFDSIVPLLSSF